MQPPAEVEVGAGVAADLAHGDRGEQEVLVPQHVRQRDLAAPEEVAAGGDADVQRGPALEVELLEDLLAPLVLRHHLVGDVGLEVDDLLRRRLHLLLDLLHRLGDLDGVELVFALEVADEADAGGALVEERLGGGVAAEHVGVLADDAGPHVEAAEVVGVVVLGGRVEDQVPVRGEDGRVVVVAAEGELGLLRGVGQREDVDLVVAGDAAGVGHELAVRGDLGIGVVERVLGEVAHGAALEVDEVDVGHALLEGGEDRALPVRQQAGRLGLVERRGAPA